MSNIEPSRGLHYSFVLKSQSILYLSLNFAVFFIWVIIKRKWDLDHWNFPISYSWDSLQTLSQIKGFEGQIPFLSKNIANLNAPYFANWSDWPAGDDFMFSILGSLSNLTNLFFASNIGVLSAHLLAGSTFLWSAQRLGISKILSWVGALGFALTPYLFTRGLQHLILAHAWHLPLLFVFAKELLATPLPSKFLKRFGLLLAVLGGVLYVYYAYIFLQVFLFIFLFSVGKKQWKKAQFVAVIFLLCILGTILGQLDTMIYQFKNGPNTLIMTRELFEVELYALKLPDLFLPLQHRWGLWHYIADRFYFNHPPLIRGELGYSYLGFIGILCFLVAIVRRIFLTFKYQSSQWTFNEGFLAWIIALSLAGGINMLIAVSTGFYGFRCTNRYSVVVLILALFIGLRVLSKHLSMKQQLFLFPLLCFFIILDLPFRESATDFEKIKSKIESDHNLVEQIESHLPDRSRVFQLPVQDYPETPPINSMSDYEQFRPTFYSKKIHWSYGAPKGRAQEFWQHRVEQQSPAEMIRSLQSFGFSGLLLNRSGYKDSAQELEKQLREMGYQFTFESGDKTFIFFKLNPASNSIFPTYEPFFEAGWYPVEKDSQGDRYWTKNSGTIIIDNPSDKPKKNRIWMKIHSLFPQKIRISLGPNESIFDTGLQGEVYQEDVVLNPGRNLIKLMGANRAQKPSNGDQRYLSFSVIGFSISDLQ